MNSQQAATLATQIGARLKSWSATRPSAGEMLGVVTRWQRAMAVAGVKAAAAKAPHASTSGEFLAARLRTLNKLVGSIIQNGAGNSASIARGRQALRFFGVDFDRVSNHDRIDQLLATAQNQAASHNSTAADSSLQQAQGEINRAIQEAGSRKSAKSADLLGEAAALLATTADDLAAQGNFRIGGGTAKAFTPAAAQDALGQVVARLGQAFAPEPVVDAQRAATVKALGFAGKGDGTAKAQMPGDLQTVADLKAILRLISNPQMLANTSYLQQAAAKLVAAHARWRQASNAMSFMAQGLDELKGEIDKMAALPLAGRQQMAERLKQPLTFIIGHWSKLENDPISGQPHHDRGGGTRSAASILKAADALGVTKASEQE